MIWRVARQQEAAARRRPYREYGRGVTATPAPAQLQASGLQRSGGICDPRRFRTRQAPRGIMKRPPEMRHRPGGDRAARETQILGWLFVIPSLLAVAALILYPMAHGFKQSIRSGGF